MQTTVQPDSHQAPAATSPSDITPIHRLCDSLRASTSDRMAWKHAAEWIGRTFEARYVLVEVDSRSGSSTITPVCAADESWQPLCDALILKSRQEVEIVSKTAGDGLHAVAIPMKQGHSTAAVGAIAVAMPAGDECELHSRTRELLAYVRLCEESIRNRKSADNPGGGSASGQQGISQAGSYDSLHQYAFAITNGLKAKFGCDEVAISILRNQKARILSISGMDCLHPRSPGTKALQQAMEEAADAGTSVVAPDNQGERYLANLPLHQQWLADTNSSAVACVPLRNGDNLVGVVALRRTDGIVFSDNDLAETEKLVAPLASGLVLLDQANRSLLAHASSTAFEASARWKTLAARTRAAVIAATILVVSWVLLGTTTYTLQVPCELVASTPIDVSVPFESRIVKAHVRPGDFVTTGQPLVEFDTTALMAEHQRLNAELKIAEIATVQALTMNDIAAAGRARNEADAARAGLARVNDQIGQAILCAPFDGYVIRGNVLRRVGETLAVGTELLQLAAEDELAVELQVNDADATHVARGMTGEFSTLAHPGEAWTCKVDQVDAAASVLEGKNIFKAQARPQESIAGWLRPGMQGIAKIDTGPQPVWWVYLHGATDWVRMLAWKL